MNSTSTMFKKESIQERREKRKRNGEVWLRILQNCLALLQSKSVSLRDPTVKWLCTETPPVQYCAVLKVKTMGINTQAHLRAFSKSNHRFFKSMAPGRLRSPQEPIMLPVSGGAGGRTTAEETVHLPMSELQKAS